MVGFAAGGGSAAGFQTLAVAAASTLQRSSQVKSIGPQSATLMSTDRRTFARSGKRTPGSLANSRASDQRRQDVKVDGCDLIRLSSCIKPDDG